MVYATRVKRVIERNTKTPYGSRSTNCYGAFVDVLARGETVRYSEQSVKGFQQLYHVTLELYNRDQHTLRRSLSRSDAIQYGRSWIARRAGKLTQGESHLGGLAESPTCSG